MTENLIREIAQQIVRQEILTNWVFYALILAVSVVSAALSAWVTSYIRKRAETYASKADLEELVRQLKETTEAAEKVKTAISHEDWAAREWKTLRRVKLEELLAAVALLEGWFESDRPSNERDAKLPPPNPLPVIRKLGILYFPELEPELDALLVKCGLYSAFLAEVRCELMAAGRDSAQIKKVTERYVFENSAHFGAYMAAEDALLERAPCILRDILAG